MEEDVLQALQTHIAYLPGTFDRHGRIIFIITISNDLQNWPRKCLELSVTYLKRSLSEVILLKGITVIVDAQKSTARISRQHARFIYGLFKDLSVNLFLVKSEGFWEKHVETCTKSNTKEEPIVLSKARLAKYFDLTNLPKELGGALQFNYDLWLQQHKSIDEFEKYYNKTIKAMDSLQSLLQNSTKSSLRFSEAEIELKKCAQIYANVHDSIETVIDMGNHILTRFNEIYAPPVVVTATSATAATTIPTPANRAINNSGTTDTIINAKPTTGRATCLMKCSLMKRPLPPDLNCERTRLELRLNEIEKRQTKLRKVWLEVMQSVREARELAVLEEKVNFVTNWILTTGEQMLNNQQTIGGDVKACEQLRAQHNALELECRETYGFYGELLYKIEKFNGNRDCLMYRDLISQQEFMQFVCRAFANRLERRRNILITSLRFFRLVNEYFERTSEIFESLVMSNTMEDFTKAANNLKKLKDSQQSLVTMERELIKEGEKLSDMLSMPVKDALGRDLHIDYSDDICNVRECLETTLARRKIFSDSVELQKLTLEQVTHIQTYEVDARMAIKWLDDLFNVMIKCHAHVGCNIHEIQVQKDELLTFQATGKSIYNYGCQLLEASQALRNTCKLSVTEVQHMQQQLQRIWYSLQAISQEHMTRLRVSAVFHRSVEDYCRQLRELKNALLKFCVQRRKHVHKQQLKKQLPQRSSSSGISSESDTQPSVDENILLLPAITTTSNINTNNENLLIKFTEQRDQLRKYLIEREQLLLEVGRMVRLGRLLKTRLKEPFILDAATGKSVIAEEIHSDMNTPSPTAESVTTTITTTDSNSNFSNTSNNSPPSRVNLSSDSSKIIVQPIQNNALACNAISMKLTEIAEVAESLDSVIRDIQDHAPCMELDSTELVNNDKKLATSARSNSSEDWHSRSTEDESFVTASEGNFTPFSQSSSSYRTASGRTTSSIVSCDKNNSSDLEDSIFPELVSPLNTSFEGSEQSFIIGQIKAEVNHLKSNANVSKGDTITKQFTDNSCQTEVDLMGSGGGGRGNSKLECSSAGIEELITNEQDSPTPIPANDFIESDAEMEMSSMANAPSTAVITEIRRIESVTPEVSLCSIHSSVVDEPHVQIQQQRFHKTNANWRHSKYYENITKQTIKGFL